jgi:hypothetical protein
LETPIIIFRGVWADTVETTMKQIRRKLSTALAATLYLPQIPLFPPFSKGDVTMATPKK